MAFNVSYTFICYSRATSIIYEHTTDIFFSPCHSIFWRWPYLITHIQDIHNLAGPLVPYNHACPKRGSIHRDRVMQLMKEALYLQATTVGFQSRTLYNQALTQVASMETKRANIFRYSEVQLSNPISVL